MDWISTATGTLGGVGLFLLGMRAMSEGLRVAAGRTLRTVLQRWTATRLRALGSGVLLTAVVQSSSAVTVAVIGFANAGLLTLGQSIAVIYGSNIGTTVTGWLVALVGFHMDVKAFALPAIGIGMALHLGRSVRVGALGEALAGFGLFFLGIDILKTALVGAQDSLSAASVSVDGVGAIVLFTGVGFALTLLMQSSSAAIAVILTSVGGGVLPIESGACLVIGANVGTTSTAALAVLGATSNAKRVAMGHVAFNVVTGAVALATLPLLLLLVGRFRQVLGLGAEPAAVVAGFHTLFNLLGVALLWPLTPRLVAWLETRFRTPEEDEGRPRYLDRNVGATPILAAGALGLELARAGALARGMAQASLRGGAPASRVAARREALGQLLEATGRFVTGLQQSRLPAELETALPTALRVARYYAEAAELSQAIAASRAELAPLPSDLAAEVRGLEQAVDDFLERTAVDRAGTTADAAATALASLEERYHALKDTLLRAGTEGRVPVGELIAHLDRLSNLRRLAEQMERAALHLWALGALVDADGERTTVVDPATPATPPRETPSPGS